MLEGNSSSGVVLQEFVYHPTEERVLVKKVYEDGDLVETVIYPNENLVRSITYPNAAAINATDTVYVKDGSGLVAANNYSDEKTYYLNDHLGSASVLTNDSGEVLEETFYEPHGGIISGGKLSRFDYEGKEYTTETGSYDFNFRGYNPELQIFTQPDTLLPNVYDPQQLNRYMFERGNPYKYVDPDGHLLLAADFTIIFGQNSLTAPGPSSAATQIFGKNDMIVRSSATENLFKEGELPKIARSSGYREASELPKGSWVRDLLNKFRHGGMGKMNEDGTADIMRWDTGHRGAEYPHVNQGRWGLNEKGIPKELSQGPLDHFPIFNMNFMVSSEANQCQYSVIQKEPPATQSSSSRRSGGGSIVYYRSGGTVTGGRIGNIGMSSGFASLAASYGII